MLPSAAPSFPAPGRPVDRRNLDDPDATLRDGAAEILEIVAGRGNLRLAGPEITAAFQARNLIGQGKLPRADPSDPVGTLRAWIRRGGALREEHRERLALMWEAAARRRASNPVEPLAHDVKDAIGAALAADRTPGSATTGAQKALDEILAPELERRAAARDADKPSLAAHQRELLRACRANLASPDAETSGAAEKWVAQTAMQIAYVGLRSATYPCDRATYAEAWEKMTGAGLPHRDENGWRYRGVLASHAKTAARASLNVEPTPECVAALDALVAQGLLDGNYKLGDPDVSACADERHDSVTAYSFQPFSEACLSGLADVARRFGRGHNLIGKKIVEGLSVADSGSVDGRHIPGLLDRLGALPGCVGLARGVRAFASNRGRMALSEGQMEALKTTLARWDLEIAYDPASGFAVTSRVAR